MKDVKYDSKTSTVYNDIFELPYYKTKNDLQELTDYVKFVKGCESLVKKHPDYDLIVRIIRETQPRCQVLGNFDRYDVTIEVHHNCLTHFDICAIITNYLLNHGETVTTPKVAKLDLAEHKAEHVQLVCLSKTVHQSIDTGKVFINLNQGIGNINEFIKKYRDGIDDHYKDKINKYIDMSEEFKSTDGKIFDLAEDMIKWNYR